MLQPPNPQIHASSSDVYNVGEDVDIYNLEIWGYLIFSLINAICILPPIYIFNGIKVFMAYCFGLSIIITIILLERKLNSKHLCFLIFSFLINTIIWFSIPDIFNLSNSIIVENAIGFIHIGCFIFHLLYPQKYPDYINIITIIQGNIFLFLANYPPNSLTTDEIFSKIILAAFVINIEIYIGKIHTKDESVNLNYIFRLAWTLYRINLYIAACISSFVVIFRLRHNKKRNKAKIIEITEQLNMNIPFPSDEDDELEKQHKIKNKEEDEDIEVAEDEDDDDEEMKKLNKEVEALTTETKVIIIEQQQTNAKTEIIKEEPVYFKPKPRYEYNPGKEYTPRKNKKVTIQTFIPVQESQKQEETTTSIPEIKINSITHYL